MRIEELNRQDAKSAKVRERKRREREEEERNQFIL
jgi:hypothetical protein